MKPSEAYPPFDNVDIKSSRLLFIHFWAGWDSYDELMADRLVDARSGLQGIATLRGLDVDRSECWSDLRTWRVINVPALGIFLNGQHQADGDWFAKH